MVEKIWNYRYEDTVIETQELDPALGEITVRNAEHLPEGLTTVTVFNKNEGVHCYIHCDEEIPGLELVAEYVTITEGW